MSRKIPVIAGSNREKEYFQEKYVLWLLKNKRKKENEKEKLAL